MESINKRAVIYCRVSTKEQVEEGNSLGTQEKICSEYALRNGFEIVEKFIEQGESAKTRNRTQLKRLLSYCADRKNKISAIIIYKLDRISRNTDDYIQIRIILKRYKVEIKSTSENFENTPAGRFMENTLANVAQFDNDVRTERAVNGLKDAMREGRYVWMAPYGYNNSREAGKANVYPNSKADLVRASFEEVAKNMDSVEVVRRKILAKGLTNKAGKPLSRSQFYRMLANKAYAGWIIKFGERHRGVYEPIVSDELFDQVQRVLKRRSRSNVQYLLENPDFPLRRFVKHSKGWSLTGSWSQGSHKKYAYYRYKATRGMEFSKTILEERFIRFMDQFQLDDKYFSRLQEAVKKNLVTATEDKNKIRLQLTGRIKALKEKQGALVQKNLQGVISDTLLQQQLDNVELEELNINAELANLPEQKQNIQRLLSEVSQFLKQPSYVWSKSSIAVQRKLQSFEFPKGVVFDGEDFRTEKVCRLFKPQKNFAHYLSHKAGHMHKTSNTLKLATSRNKIESKEDSAIAPIGTSEEYWQKVQGEIVALSNILNGKDDSNKDEVSTFGKLSLLPTD